MQLQGKTPFPPRKPEIPAKTHAAIIAGYVDLGTQPGYKPGDNPSRRVSIAFEFPGVMVKTKDSGPMPAWLSADYTAMMGRSEKRTKLGKLAVAALGRDIADDEQVDLRSLIGANVLVSVIHRPPNAKGDVWESVGEVLAIPDGMPQHKLRAPPMVFDLTDDLGNLVEPPERLGRFKIERIKSSLEWNGGELKRAQDIALTDVDDTPF